MTAAGPNSLARASSSYLRSAMHQPIRWHEWGEDAFAAARRENKPILLDIGAVWCHWCHVMDRESYDDPEVANIVNENFIAVKVDRDERPDIDSRHQIAVSALTGQGGWPLTAFLTPDGKPFYGGTYFPPNDGYGRPSFKRVLVSIAQAYREKNADVLEQAIMVESAIARAETLRAATGEISQTAIDAVIESALKMFDDRNGGFGSAPKFPHPSVLDLLIERNSLNSNEELQHIFVSTLEKMARGGVYDQLAGGFHRYSVDERWVVPHFEKMCYDNSELLKNYVHAYQATAEEFFASIARDTIRWMDEWLSDRAHGGFYASQDADYSMDDDGDYFTWTLEEVQAVLTKEEADAANLYYDVSEIGDMHHNPAKNVLYLRAGTDEIARRLKITHERVSDLLASAKKKMYAARLARPTPYIDKTLYVGWNAMCISAYLEAAKVLDLDDTRRFALRSLDRVLAEGWVPNPMLSEMDGANSKISDSSITHSNPPQATSDSKLSDLLAPAPQAHAPGLLRHVIAYSDPKAERRETTGVLEDYAFTVIACLDAYEASADLSYFRFARKIADAMIAGFYDRENGGFFDTRIEPASFVAAKSPTVNALPTSASLAGTSPATLGILGMLRKPFQDSPTPAGNSVAAIALLRLHGYTNEACYRDLAKRTLQVYAASAPQHGIFAATYALAVARFLAPHTQIVVVGTDAAATGLHRAAARWLAPNTSLIRLDAGKVVAQNLPPVLADTIPHLPTLSEGRSFAVVCSNFACQPPVCDAEDLSRLLEAQARPAA
ncbi:MAG: thioredoxin domain-containing protein [Terriglobales bacterium]